MSNKTISQFTALTILQEQGTKMLIQGTDGLYYSIDPQYIYGGLFHVRKTITQAEMQAGNTTGGVILEAQGAGTAIQLVDGFASLVYAGTAYGAATKLRIHHSGQANYQHTTSASFVQSASIRRENILPDNSAAINYVTFANTDLVWSLDADATGNGGRVFINVLLRIIRSS